MTVSQALLRQQVRAELLAKRAGTADPWKAQAAGASLIGASQISKGLAEQSNAIMKAESIERRQNEVSQRADIAIGNIIMQGAQVRSAQETTFAKAGVKLEGSALNVLGETARQASEAARVRQREADFENSQMAKMKAVSQVNADYAMFNAILSGATTAGTAFVK